MENGNITDVNSLDASNINSTILTTTTQPLHTNNNDVATTAFVHNELIDYALLNPITQTFTGNNNFITQAIGNNSTLVATTAFIKNQNYITAASLAGYALLDPPTTQLWGNVTTPQDNWWYGNTFSYDTIESVNGFSIKSSPTSLSPLITINSNGTIVQTSTGTNNLFNTVLTGTSNQLSIKNSSNVSASTISQAGSSLTISAVSGNAPPQTNIILSSRKTDNTSCILLNGNSTQLNIGTDTATTNLQATTHNFTGSGVTTFSGVTKFNSSCQAIFPADFRLVDTTNITQLYQSGSTGTITGNFNSSRLEMSTKNSTGTSLSSLVIQNGNRITLQGSTGNGIDILDNQITLGGLTPVMTNQPSILDSSNKIASTQFVQTLGANLLLGDW